MSTNRQDPQLNTQRESGGRGLPTLPSLRIYQHSNLVYWWVIWLYGYTCAFLTYVEEHKVTGFLPDNPDRGFYVHPSPWLGLSFVALLLILILATNVRARGLYSLLAVMAFFIIALTIQVTSAWKYVLELFPHLLIFMNLAFYMLISTSVLVIWLLALLVFDRMTYWDFTPGQVTRVKRIGEGAHAYDTRGMVVERIPGDILVNKVLGLAFLRFGTADLRLTTAGANRESFQIENVWRAGLRELEIRELISSQINLAGKEQSAA